ncbi:MAG: arabinose isomerase [Stomatobaculum sp.]|nr:arabinose isomerase [Stomatobaculum sp.]
MLVNTKARVGVFSIALGAYLPQFPSLVPEFEAQYEAFKKTIPDTVEVIDGGMITTKEQSQAAGDKFRAADVDLVFMQLLTYATSYNMLPAIRDLDVPVVLVNVQKLKALDYDHTDIASWLGEGYACGAVGESAADLQRFGKRFDVITGVVEGGDPTVQHEIEDWCKAAQVRRRFRDTNIAQIGRPYPGMMDLYIDETNLYRRMFLYTKQFDWEKMWAIADNITDDATIRSKAQEILDTFDIEGGGSIEEVWEMAKYVVAFEQWVKDEKLGLIASHYDGFAQGKAGVLDSMLIPAFSMLIKQGTACAVEGDMKVAMGMSILSTIAGEGQLAEMYSIDFNDDTAIIGHSGSGDARISGKKPTMKIVKVFHGKTGGGYLTQFYPRLGPVTYLAITQDGDGNFKFIVAEAENIDKKVLSIGDTNNRVQFTCGAREFVNRWSLAGPTHHFAEATGRHIDTILKVAKILNVPVEIVTR